jgi:hypothetical protein
VDHGRGELGIENIQSQKVTQLSKGTSSLFKIGKRKFLRYFVLRDIPHGMSKS